MRAVRRLTLWRRLVDGRHRGWSTMLGTVIFLLFYYGAGYAVLGDRGVSPAFRVLAEVPGHMHTQGAIMLGLAAALTYGMGCRGHFLRVALGAAWGYAVYVVWTILWTWGSGHTITGWGAPAGWLLIFYFTWYCWLHVPPHARRWSDRVRQA